jgi:hypothetical protein
MKTWIILTVLGTIHISGYSHAALFERLNGLAFYDDVSNLTWLSNANTGAGSVYDSNLFSSSTGGAMSWQNANAWAASLDINGVTGWRLPTADASCGSYNCIISEMGKLFYNVFDGVAQTPIGNNANFALFNNVQPYTYWSATESSDTRAYTFWFETGYQSNHNKFNERYAWAVHTGDVEAVPVPAAAWLFGSGLIGLVGLARHKKS